MATYWLANGVPVKVVSDRLGHANIAIPPQIYAHALPNMQAEAAQEMDAWFVAGVTRSGRGGWPGRGRRERPLAPSSARRVRRLRGWPGRDPRQLASRPIGQRVVRGVRRPSWAYSSSVRWLRIRRLRGAAVPRRRGGGAAMLAWELVAASDPDAA